MAVSRETGQGLRARRKTRLESAITYALITIASASYSRLDTASLRALIRCEDLVNKVSTLDRIRLLLLLHHPGFHVELIRQADFGSPTWHLEQTQTKNQSYSSSFHVELMERTSPICLAIFESEAVYAVLRFEICRTKTKVLAHHILKERALMQQDIILPWRRTSDFGRKVRAKGELQI